MAEALLGFVVENLVSFVRNEFVTISEIKKKVKELQPTLKLIRAALDDAEEKQFTKKLVKVWLQQLKDAVYVLDDILDECSIESHRLGGLSAFNPKNIMFSHGIGSRLKEITRRLDQIAEDRIKLGLRDCVGERPSEVAEWRETSSNIGQHQVHGRDGDKEKIVEFLLSQARGSDFLSIYPIVGLGGMGKTTLAQLVYNDERVSSHFDKTIWVCVSENFSIKRILCSILASIAEQKSDAWDLDVLEREVKAKLKNKSYLLVLDDVWNRSEALQFGLSNEKWNKLKSVLSSGSKDIEKDDCSGDISFKMHDLVHDLAQSVMGKECMCFENVNMIDLSENTHHVGFSPDDRLSFDKGFFKKVESLRTLYQFETYNNCISTCFAKHCPLRALSIACYELPSFQNLVHLRYLELDGSSFEIQTLPHSICGLRKLEILKVINFHGLKCLPNHLSCLQNLRHLIIRKCPHLSHMFPNIGKLSCLRTLSIYIVSSEQGHSLTELQNLKLGGKLKIKGLGNVGSIQEAEQANLSSKKDLRRLVLCWDSSDQTVPSATHAEQVFEALQPHSSLKKLAIYNYQGFHLPRWFKILNNLVVLKFVDCKNCEQLPSFGKLPCLRKLKIRLIDGVQYIDDECYDGVAFPALKELILEGLPKLERLLKVERGNMFPSLSELSIEGCQRLVLPWLPSVERLEVNEFSYELPRSISGFYALTFLDLDGCSDLTSFPDGMWRNLTCLKSLRIWNFPDLKELPYELFHLNTLEDLVIGHCPALECLPEQIWEGLHSLQTFFISSCDGLRSLPEALRYLSSLEVLTITDCATLTERWDPLTQELDLELNPHTCGSFDASLSLFKLKLIARGHVIFTDKYFPIYTKTCRGDHPYRSRGQIPNLTSLKISETLYLLPEFAAKNSVSLGFFKLALEAACEKNIEQAQVSESILQLPEQGLDPVMMKSSSTLYMNDCIMRDFTPF
ncbi:hypothetical protein VNO77_31975 [Canavalia gladiata]|uniref:Uncharacterized protein n=1 Tax=Canavalia gladiata TaxID=3824 RepID=A0AAN9Q4U9_CANGL